MARVMLSIGEYELREPTLAGWSRILGSVGDEQFLKLAAALQAIVATPDEDLSADKVLGTVLGKGVMEQLIPLVREAPGLAQAVMFECLRDESKNRPDCSEATLTDAVTFLSAALEAKLLSPFWAAVQTKLLKKEKPPVASGESGSPT